MKNVILLLFLVVPAFCVSNASNVMTYVLEYEDFGPPIIAHELIGSDWWQWQSHGDSRPRKYDIRVVVYKNIPLAEVKTLYPVIPLKNQDYRYVNYDDTLKYLDGHIAENVIEKLTKRLVDTKHKIIRSFRDK